MAKLTSADQMRINNIHRVLQEIVQKDGVCRKDVALQTGLSSQTVTNLVKDLIEKGIVEEKTFDAPTQRGRNPIGLSFCSSRFYMLTAIASGEGIEVVLHTMDGNIIDRKLAPLISPEKNLHSLRSFSHEYKREVEAKGSRIMAEVISVEGVVNEATGEVIRATGPEWTHLNLHEAMKTMNIPVYILNDVNVQAQYISLTKNDAGSRMIIKLDNGIGSSFILNGKVLQSLNNVAGEFGHVTVLNTNEIRRCRCGKENCLTKYISIPSLEHQYQKDKELFFRDCRDGKAEALQICNSIVEYLTPLLANLIGLLDLDEVLFIGRTTRELTNQIFPYLDTAIRAKLSSWSNPRSICPMEDKSLWEISPLIVLDDYFSHHADTPYLWDVD